MKIVSSNIFTADWYERPQMVFSNNTSYSSFLLSKDQVTKLCGNKELSKSTSPVLNHFVNAILCTNNIYVYINDEDSSYTDGKRIMVSSLKEWDLNKTGVYAKFDTLLGLAIHEACHCKFTKFDLEGLADSGLVHWFSNVIEDEAIENSLKNRAGGYAKFLDCVKYYYFDKKFDGKFICNSDIETVTKIFINIIRYPKFLNTCLSEEEKTKWTDVFYNIYNILNKYNCIIKVNKDCSVSNTNNTKNNLKASREIVKYLKDKLNLSDEEINKQYNNAKNTKGTAINEENNKNNRLGTSNELDDNIKDLLNKKLDEIESLNNKNNSNLDKEDEITLNTICNQISKMVDGIKVNESKFNESNYKKYYKIVYPYINKTINLFCNKSTKLEYKQTRYNLSGQIDGSCIASAFIGNKFVCKQQKEVKKEVNKGKMAVVLMVDCSGSMGFTNSIAEHAGIYTTLIAEAVNSLPDCELYIFKSNNCKNICIVDNDYNKTKNSLGTIAKEYMSGGQNEVNTYNNVIKYVREKTKLPICAINITDCEYGSSAIDIKETVDYIKREYKSVISLLAINEKSRNKDNELIYGENNYINCHKATPNEINRVIKELSRIIKGQYKKIYKK